MRSSETPVSGTTRSGKSQAAFRTISEVADELDVAQHVLRFWESKFPQVRPLKRGGGRRYYRPEDIDLLRDIRSLLYDEGYTIKGAQKLLRQRRAKPTAPSRPTDNGHTQAELVGNERLRRADHPVIDPPATDPPATDAPATDAPTTDRKAASETESAATPPEADQPAAVSSAHETAELAALQRLRADLQALRRDVSAALDAAEQ